MTDPTPLDDIMLDRLLGTVDTPEIAPGFADRVVAEAARAGRPATVPPLPPRVRGTRRPWARRGMWAGVVAINLIVASAIAATLTGVAPPFAHVVAAAAHILHIHRHKEPPPHRVAPPPPVRRLAHAVPPPAPPSARPAQIVHRFAPAPMLGPRMSRMHARPEIRADRHLRAALRAGPARQAVRKWSGRDRAARPNAGRPGKRAMPGTAAHAPLGARGFDRGPWAGEMRRPWAQGWNGPRPQGMRPWRQRGQGGWRRPGRGGGRGMGWRRPFGRGRRF